MTNNNNTSNNTNTVNTVDISALDKKLAPVFQRLYSGLLNKARWDDNFMAKLRRLISMPVWMKSALKLLLAATP